MYIHMYYIMYHMWYVTHSKLQVKSGIRWRMLQKVLTRYDDMILWDVMIWWSHDMIVWFIWWGWYQCDWHDDNIMIKCWYDDTMIWWCDDTIIWWYDDMAIWWYDDMIWHDDNEMMRIWCPEVPLCLHHVGFSMIDPPWCLTPLCLLKEKNSLGSYAWVMYCMWYIVCNIWKVKSDIRQCMLWNTLTWYPQSNCGFGNARCHEHVCPIHIYRCTSICMTSCTIFTIMLTICDGLSRAFDGACCRKH